MERVLAKGEASDAILLLTQKRLAEEEAAFSLVQAARYQRAANHRLFENVRTGKKPLKDLLESFRNDKLNQPTPADFLVAGYTSGLERTEAAVLRVLHNPDHPQFSTLWSRIAERGYGRITEQREDGQARPLVIYVVREHGTVVLRGRPAPAAKRQREPGRGVRAAQGWAILWDRLAEIFRGITLPREATPPRFPYERGEVAR